MHIVNDIIINKPSKNKNENNMIVNTLHGFRTTTTSKTKNTINENYGLNLFSLIWENYIKLIRTYT